MKVVAPTHLLRQAAAILELVRDDVVVIGALGRSAEPTVARATRNILRELEASWGGELQ